MSPAPSPSVRVLVCGNPDRGDDGAAVAAVATVLPTLPADVLARLEVRRCPQLAARDLLDIPSTVRAVIVDAALGAAPGQVVVVPLGDLAGRSDTPIPHSSHAVPADLPIRLAALIRSDPPDGTFVGIGGRSFGYGATLSRPVREGLAAFRSAVAEELTRLASVPA